MILINVQYRAIVVMNGHVCVSAPCTIYSFPVYRILLSKTEAPYKMQSRQKFMLVDLA